MREKKQRRVVYVYGDWREDVVAGYEWTLERQVVKKGRIDSEIKNLRKQIQELQEEKRNMKKPILDVSNKAYERWVEENRKEAEKEGMDFAIIKKEEFYKKEVE